VIIDSALRNPQTGSTDDAYISECIETTKKAADMLSNSEYREAVLLLKDHIDQIIPNRILLVELRMFQLFLFALRSSTSTSKDYHHKEVQFRELRHAFLIQLFPHRESNSLEQLDAVLIEGLIKINPPIAGTQI
jgi:hypothetical protein